MSHVHKKGSAEVTVNMTPLIDVVFLLILFFMLVNNIIAEEAIRLQVPELDEPQTRELGDVQKLVVSVAPADDYTDAERMADPLGGRYQTAQRISVGWKDWNLDVVPLGEALDELAEILKEQKERQPDLEVLLRADAALHFVEVEPVMMVITGAGIETVHLVADLPPAGAPGN